MDNCRTCDKVPYINIRWKDALAGTGASPEPNAIAKSLEFRQPLKFGALYQCRNCYQYWFLDESSFDMHRVLPEFNDLLFKWAETSLIPTTSQISSLQSIGASVSTWSSTISIPCGITLNSQIHLEPVIIRISKMPPLSGLSARAMLGSDALTIFNSDYTLPLDVRIATSKAKEIRMCFSPTPVEVKGGRVIILNGEQFFFGHQGIKGCDVTLTSQNFAESKSHFVDNDTLPPVSLVYFDWFEECEKIFEI